MVKKEFLVLGLGKFGMSIAKTLSKMGCQVIAVDKMRKKFKISPMRSPMRFLRM